MLNCHVVSMEMCEYHIYYIFIYTDLYFDYFQLLRTCSEPDLTKLTVPKSDLVKSGVLSQSVGNMTEIGEEVCLGISNI